MSLRITIESPELSQAHEIILDRSPVSVGRSSRCDVRLVLGTLSGHHLTFRQRGGGWEVADMGSTNGTTLEGARLVPEVYVPVPEGATLRVVDIAIHTSPVASLEEGLTLEHSATMMREMLGDMLRQKERDDVASLEVLAGSLRGQRFPLHDSLSRAFIGGAPGALARLHEAGVAAEVMVFSRDDASGGFFVEPGSGGALTVDGAPTSGRVKLRSGQRVAAPGVVEVIFRDPLEDFLGDLDIASAGGSPGGDDAPAPAEVTPEALPREPAEEAPEVPAEVAREVEVEQGEREEVAAPEASAGRRMSTAEILLLLSIGLVVLACVALVLVIFEVV